jgi:hypothetical protein
MRTPRALAVALAVALLGALALAACGGDDDGLSTEAQRYADAFARDLADGDDGLAVDDEGGQCVGEAIMRELGTGPFKEAKIEPADLAGDESPGELLGSGVVSDEQADAIAEAWNECVDLPEAFALQASDEFGLDDAGVTCFEDELRASDVLDEYLRVSFTSADAAEGRTVLNRIVGLVQQCSAQGGSGGVLVDSLAASFAEDGQLTPDEATCLAQHVVDEVGADELVGIGSGETLADAPEALQQQFAAAIVKAAEQCDLDLTKLG